MYAESELLPVSALQHLVFCERQCALIYLEMQWADNRLTAEGSQLHDRVHEQQTESRGDMRIARSLPLRSLRLGLVGVADVIEFHLTEPEPGGVATLPGVEGHWQPFPVEYKRGRPKAEHCDEVQLCAQALCLEEMWSVRIPRGALFYGKIRRRRDVEFDDALRRLTEETAERLHRLIESGSTPAPSEGKWCRACSLVDVCLPKAAHTRSAKRYLRNSIRDVLE